MGILLTREKHRRGKAMDMTSYSYTMRYSVIPQPGDLMTLSEAGAQRTINELLISMQAPLKSPPR